MRDVFISHAGEDEAIAIAVARRLAAAGFTTWIYEDDSDPGPSYLRQVDEALASTQAVVIILSRAALASGTVLAEAIRAHEAGKPFIPLRAGVSHDEVQRHADLRMTLGASVSVAVDASNLDEVIPRVIRGLERSGVTRSGAVGDVPGGRRPHPPVVRPGPPELARCVAGVIDRVSPPMRIAVATVVGVLGVIGSIANVMNVIDPDGQTQALYRAVPAIGSANLAANAVALLFNAVLLYSMWELHARRAPVQPRVRLVTALLLMTIVVWLVVVVFAALFPPYGRLRGADRLSIIGASVLAAAIAAAPAALVRALFRR